MFKKKSLRLNFFGLSNFSMIFIFIIFIIGAGIIDRSVTRISLFEEVQFYPAAKLVFISVLISSLFIQSLFLCKVYLGILQIMRKKSKSPYLIPLTFHFLNLFFVLLLVTQMIIDDHYAKYLILFIIWNSVTIGILILSFLTYRLLLWIKESFDKNVVVIAYSVAIISIILLNTFTLLYFSLGYRIGTEYIDSTTIPSVIFSNSYGFFAIMINYISILSFFLLCGSTVLLLLRRSEKMKVKHIVMISTSIIIFLSSYLFLWGFSSMRYTDVLLFHDIYNITKIIAFPLGGIFFGFTFWMIARSMKNQAVKSDHHVDENRQLRESMYLTAIGIVLILFSSAPLDITRLPYPPFGLVSFTYINTGSLSLFLGIYNIALSIAGSSQIRKGMHEKSDFLFSIGSSQHRISKRKSITRVLGDFRNYLLDSKVNEENLDKEYIDEVKNYLQVRKTSSNLKNITFTINESPFGKTWKSWIELWCEWYYYTRKIRAKGDTKEDYGLSSKNELLFLTKFNLNEKGKRIEYQVTLPRGKILFMPIICNLVTFHDHPEIHSEQELRLFSKNELDKKNVVFLSINDTEIKDIKQYRIQSDLFLFKSLTDLNDVSGTETQAISYGYWIFINPLSLGKNKMHFKIQKRFDQELTKITYESEVIMEVTLYLNII